MSSPVVMKKGEGKPLWMLGSLYEVRVASDASGGACTVMEMTIPPGMSAPPHKHNGAEILYVLEGMFKLHIENRTVDAGPGTCAFFPKGTLEWMEATGRSPGKVLVVYAPGGMDKFFTEVAEPAKSRSIPPPPTSPPDVAKLVAAGKRHGLEIVPPKH
ncbi:MAG: cupin domain-containing protein [Chloroflexi bacterium]|nr:cupin domain-containing protein [Chloroflexota bacterium]